MDRNFWKAQDEGDSIEGKFSGIFKMGLGYSAKLVTADEEEVFINLTLVVADALDKGNVKLEDDVLIEFKGVDKRTKIFDVTINGKLVDRNAPVDTKEGLKAALALSRAED